VVQILIDEKTWEAASGERLIDALNRSESKLPQVCYYLRSFV